MEGLQGLELSLSPELESDPFLEEDGCPQDWPEDPHIARDPAITVTFKPVSASADPGGWCPVDTHTLPLHLPFPTSTQVSDPAPGSEETGGERVTPFSWGM